MFFDETGEHINSLNEGLLELEENLKISKQDNDLINVLFRAFHSIKGAAGMLGFAKINKLTHNGENLLDLVREGKIPVTEETVQCLLEALDGLSSLINELEDGVDEYNMEPVIARIQHVIENGGSVAVKKETPSIDIQRYLPIFIEDTKESVTAMEACLLRNDESLKDEDYVIPDEDVNELFRYVHQIKGGAGTMGFTDICDLSHAAESVLEQVRSKNYPFDSKVSSLLLQSIDHIQTKMDMIAGENFEDLPTQKLCEELFAQIGKTTHRASSTPQTTQFTYDDYEKLLSLFNENAKILKCDFKVSQDEVLQGMRAFMAYSRMSDFGDVICSVPESDQLPDLDTVSEFSVYLCHGKEIEEIKTTFSLDQVSLLKVSEFKKDDLEKPEDKLFKDDGDMGPMTVERSSSPKNKTVQTMRVDIDRLDHLMNMSGELVINKAYFSQLENELKDLLDYKNIFSQVQDVQQQITNLTQNNMQNANNMEHVQYRLESCLNQLHSILEDSQKIKKGKSIFNNYQVALHQLDLASEEIQRAVMDIRMVPVGPLFNRFKRVVRDISKSTGKEIRLLVCGEDTEIDKKMADELVDPLTHMVRNAADHGIELPSVRRDSGKDNEGTLILNAQHKGNGIVLTIQDDGKGLDPKMISNKAIEKKIKTQDEISLMSDEEIFQLIFAPGFSTAAQVTSISGRGVGMDIVKKKIEELSGQLEIKSQLGKGTTFEIHLPLTLAIQKSLLCEVYGTCFAFPLESVSEIVSFDKSKVQSVQDEKVIRIRDQVIPVFGLEGVFKNTEFSPNFMNDDSSTLVVVGEGKKSMALIVHRLLGEEDIVIKSLSQNLSNIDGLSGASILGNGKIALILDVVSMIDRMNNYIQTVQ